jgi:ribosomal protein L14
MQNSSRGGVRKTSGNNVSFDATAAVVANCRFELLGDHIRRRKLLAVGSENP